MTNKRKNPQHRLAAEIKSDHGDSRHMLDIGITEAEADGCEAVVNGWKEGMTADEWRAVNQRLADEGAQLPTYYPSNGEYRIADDGVVTEVQRQDRPGSNGEPA